MADTDPAAPTFDDATSVLQTQLDPQAALERLQMRRVQREAQDAAAYRVVELVRDLRRSQILEATEPTVLVSLREWEALREAAADVPPRGERRCIGG
jgi:hypothetical protein